MGEHVAIVTRCATLLEMDGEREGEARRDMVSSEIHAFRASQNRRVCPPYSSLDVPSLRT